MEMLKNLSKLEKALLLILGILVSAIFCLWIGISFYRSFSTANSDSSKLPSYTVNDVSDNKETNVAYFLIADKNLTKLEAEKIIKSYSDKHIKQKGYKLINVWIFCDNTYANYTVLNNQTVTDDEFYSHVLYWYQAGEWSSEGLIFVTEPNADYPTFGNSCR